MPEIQTTELPVRLFRGNVYRGHDRFILLDAAALSADLSRFRRPRRPGDLDGAHRRRARALTDAVFPALTWMRDNHGIYIGDAPMLRASFDLRWMEDLLYRQVVSIHTEGILNPLVIEERILADVPASVLAPMRRYIEALPDYQPGLSISRQKRILFQQHGYAAMYFFPYLSLPRDHWNRRIAYAATQQAICRPH